jgi:hypothetical protein
METFRGSGHLPGAPKVWEIELDTDWDKKEFTVRIPAARAQLTEWPGLMVQTIGSEEAVFRTHGIPPLQVHWWHVVKNPTGVLWVMVLVPAHDEGIWLNCGLRLEKTGS